MSHEKYPASRPHGPFDDSAPEWLRRMGLLTAEGKPDRDAMAVVSRLYAGIFYDDLCDFYSEMGSVNNVCRELIDCGGAHHGRGRLFGQEEMRMKKCIPLIALVLALTMSTGAFSMEVPTDTIVQNLNGSQQVIKT